MGRALELAWQGWGRVAPNPLVGAVVLSNGEVVGEGHHAEFGGLHAERAALDAAGSRARGGTLVVTLEPCSHTGKQPPCTDAVLEAGIRRVVYALSDPNPAAAGGGALLKAHGVAVTHGIRAAEAAAQNAAFLHHFRNSDRPFVALKLAVSIDGRIADRAGNARWISGEAAREWVQWLRAGFDAIAVGAETARRDDPSLTVRGSVTPRRTPTRVVLGRSGRIATGANLVRTAREVPTMLFAAPEVAVDPALESAGVMVRRAETLPDALEALRADGIGSLLVEGGGRIASALLEAQLVDRIYWVQAPVLIGGGTQAVESFGPGRLEDAARWRVVERRPLGDDTLIVMDA